MSIKLMTTFYFEDCEKRREELLTCIERNIANKAFSEIFVFLDPPHQQLIDQLPNSSKLTLVERENRTTYDDFIDFANTNFPPNDLFLIANTDIYFDDTVGALEKLDLHRAAVALTRWECHVDDVVRRAVYPAMTHVVSQDAWAMRTPVKPVQADYHLGILGCDGRFAYELQRAGYEVYNPCKSIRAIHLHRVVKRNYDRNFLLEGKYLGLYPSKLRNDDFDPWQKRVILDVKTEDDITRQLMEEVRMAGIRMDC